jgi:cephalosporin hydroxylase
LHLQGSSTSPANVERVRKEASLARSVLVLLDSGHHATHVAEEMVSRKKAKQSTAKSTASKFVHLPIQC